MSIIVALIPSANRLQRLHAAVRDAHTIVPCETMGDVVAACSTRPVHVAVLDLEAAGAPNFDPVRELKRRAPRVALVAYAALTPERMRHVFDAGRYGFDELVVADVDDGPARFARALEKAGARGAASLLRAVLPAVADPVARDALMLVVTRAHEGLTPVAVAHVVGVPPRTLSRALAAAGLPSSHRLVTWGRLLVAAALMDDTHHSADRIALALGFPSGSAFRNTCRRYLGATPTGIRAAGGAEWVAARFAAAAARTRSTEPAPNVSGLQGGERT